MTMTDPEIARLRLLNQRISLPGFEEPGEVVDWLGAVQAQDYAGSKWALGSRMRGATDKDIDKAFNEGTILRTHVLRPTWHFVRPGDIRWLLTLTAPRVHAASAYMYRRTELDGATFRRSDAVLAKALTGGKHLTRDELRVVLENAHIFTGDGVRLSYLMMHAELEGIICSGPQRGKQFTYALLEERAPQTKTLGREEALAELSRRFFRSRGPATVQDFAKWSGLTLADARSSLEAIKSGFEHETINGQDYWFLRPRAPIMADSPTAYLLSVYDEYISSYKDRSAMEGEDFARLFSSMGNTLQYVILINGKFVGTGKRTLKKDAVIVQLNPLIELMKEEKEAIAEAAERFGAFLELPVTLEM
jgi:hypothetical protein